MPSLSRAQLLRSIDETWPAVDIVDQDGWRLRLGQGGGSRVSATTAHHATTSPDIAQAEAWMQEQGQTPLFMVTAEDADLDGRLADRGYSVKDPVTVYLGDIADLAADPLPPVTTFQNWPPLAICRDIWAEAGIGHARQSIMQRATGAKTCILGRCKDAPAGAAFAARSGNLVMMHALEVRTAFRRQGLGRHMVRAAAHWARQQGANTLGLLVTTDNVAANALYRQMGMTASQGYHYRIKAKA